MPNPEKRKQTKEITTGDIKEARKEAKEFEGSTEQEPKAEESTNKKKKDRLSQDEIKKRQENNNRNIEALRDKISSGEVMLSSEGEARKQLSEIKNSFEGSFENEEINNEIIQAYIDDEAAQKIWIMLGNEGEREKLSEEIANNINQNKEEVKAYLDNLEEAGFKTHTSNESAQEAKKNLKKDLEDTSEEDIGNTFDSITK